MKIIKQITYLNCDEQFLLLINKKSMKKLIKNDFNLI